MASVLYQWFDQTSNSEIRVVVDGRGELVVEEGTHLDALGQRQWHPYTSARAGVLAATAVYHALAKKNGE